MAEQKAVFYWLVPAITVIALHWIALLGLTVITNARLHSRWRQIFWAHAVIKTMWCDTCDVLRNRKKNCANLSFAHCLSNMNQFQRKVEGLSRNKPLTKLCLKCSLFLKYVLALPCKIWSVRLSRQRNNLYIWMINWIATNMTGSYCLSKRHTCHITSSLLQRVLKMSASSMNANV